MAYFSAEFGFHESLPIYSGGLGILAGDHVKGASDLGVPLVGVGLYYDQGYFRPRLDRDGWQQEDYIDVDSRLLPIQPAVRGGIPIVISIATRTGTIAARVWKLAVGRCTVLLLDSNVDGNQPEDRELTSRLYGGDDRVRIRQELLLGIGGVRALDALGIAPGVVHLNEGHSAFAAIGMVRTRMALEGIGPDEAIRRVAAQVVFTTHTPVPAGHDRFTADLVEEHLGPVTLHDSRDGDALLCTLRDEVVPMYYDRDRDGLPRAWIARMKHAIRTLGWRFSADRMVMDYVLRTYIPAAGGTSCDTSRC